MLTAEGVSEAASGQGQRRSRTSARMEGRPLTAYFADQAEALKGGRGRAARSAALVTFLGPQRRSLEEVFIEKVRERKARMRAIYRVARATFHEAWRRTLPQHHPGLRAC